VPAVVLTTEKFAALTERVATSYGLADLRVAVVPHPLGGTAADSIRSWADSAVDDVVGLCCGGDQRNSS